MDPNQDNPIFRHVSRRLVPLILLYGLYVVLNGHLSPGGGFSGGAIIGVAIMLCDESLRQQGTALPRRIYPWISGSALLLYLVLKGVSFLLGAYHLPDILPPGEPGRLLSGGLILPLNLCVGIIVACTMAQFFSLFREQHSRRQAGQQPPQEGGERR